MRSTLRFRQAVTRSVTVEVESSAKCVVPVPEDVRPRSIYSAALEEAYKHKWIESQKSGHDLGDTALKDWFRKYWLPFCRAKRLEHVEGMQKWSEFAETEFGQVFQLIMVDDLLCDRVLDRMENGFDNLEIINWGLAWGLPMDRVLDLLELININRARLEPIAITG